MAANCDGGLAFCGILREGWSPVAGVLQGHQHLLVVSENKELDVLLKQIVQVGIHSLDLQEVN